MKFGVVIFPGSNCDRDMIDASKNDLQQEVITLWHKDKDLSMFNKDDCIVLPGGFSYGDYLRCGAIARFSPMMQSVIEFANKGGKVLGICNGFPDTYAKVALLPGVLLRNMPICNLCVKMFLLLPKMKTGKKKSLKIPVAHGEGRYFASDDVLNELEQATTVLYRYCNNEGLFNVDYSPNGSSQ